jgi:PhnB protein
MALTQVQPYLLFGGRCEEALKFYQRAIGARIGMLMRWSESPDKPPPGMLAPGFENKVMHSELHIGEHTVMASDGSTDKEKSSGFSLALTVTTEAEVDNVFGALIEGGQATMPPGPTFWTRRFAMGTDRFGVGWMVMVAGQSGG